MVMKSKELVSYKDKLLGFNGVQYAKSEKEEMQLENLEEDEVNKAKKDKEEPNEIEDDPAYPTVKLIAKEKRELCKPWKRSLIVKLLGKQMGMRFLKLRL